jgi:hypothetical protein
VADTAAGCRGGAGRRTIDGPTIDKTISDTVTGYEFIMERVKRRRWQETMERAQQFAELTANG